MILTPGSPALDVLNSRPQQRLDQGRMNTFWIGLHEPVRLFMASPYFMARKISLRFLVLLDPSYKRTDRNGKGHEWGQWFTIRARVPLHDRASVPAAAVGGVTEGTPGLVDEIQSLQYRSELITAA